MHAAGPVVGLEAQSNAVRPLHHNGSLVRESSVPGKGASEHCGTPQVGVFDSGQRQSVQASLSG